MNLAHALQFVEDAKREQKRKADLYDDLLAALKSTISIIAYAQATGVLGNHTGFDQARDAIARAEGGE